MNNEVTIIGAGIGGLAAALCLQKAGVQVKVYEQAPALKEVGAGLTLTPNATHVLRELGLEEQLLKISNQPGPGVVRHWQSGDVLLTTRINQDPIEQYGAPMCQVHRADLHDMLATAVAKNDPECISLNYRLANVVQNDDAVKLNFENDQTITTKWVIAADGVRSVIRDSLYEPEEVAFTGQVAFRGLVPVDKLERELITPSSAISIGPSRFFLRYLVRNKSLVNFVAVTTTDSWQEEGWSTPASNEEVLELYSGWDKQVREIIAATPEGNLFKWALCGRGPLASWIKGRVALLGDACHPTLPFLGQGAAMAFEDAMVLSRCLKDCDDYQEAFKIYDQARRPRTDKLCEMAAAQGVKFQGDKPEEYNAKAPSEGQNDWVFGYNPVTVAI